MQEGTEGVYRYIFINLETLITPIVMLTRQRNILTRSNAALDGANLKRALVVHARQSGKEISLGLFSNLPPTLLKEGK
jgi:hypothetical protein